MKTKTKRSPKVKASKKLQERHPRGRLDDGTPNPIDKHIGRRIRLRRTLLGLSQEELGDKLGLTFQQVQKYESGNNRVGGSRFYDLSCVLDVPISYFFDDMPDDITRLSPASIVNMTTSSRDVPDGDNESLPHLRAAALLSNLDPGNAKSIMALIRALSDGK